jgi:hypothetical protein
MRIQSVSMLFGFFLLSFVECLAGPSWKLPQGAGVKDTGSRTYRFTVDYSTSDTQGRIIQRQQIKGDYTRGLPGGMAVWKNVSLAESVKAGGPLGPARQREFMNGLQYNRKSFDPLSPDFFKGFPATAVNERNLVWDATMIEHFGQDYFEHLSLNQTYHLTAEPDVTMPGVGVFHNRDVQLVWTGRSRRNGQDCALIEYGAYLNSVEMAIAGMTFKGRSHYWGQIWVSLSTKQIEYATLYEDVLGEARIPGNDSTQIMNVFRCGVFEPVAGD